MITRLSCDIVPSSYSIRIEPDLKSMSFKGEAVISFNIAKKNDHMELHSHGSIKIFRIYQLDSKELKYSKEEEILKIYSDDFSHPVKIEYQGKITEDNFGFYKCNSNIYATQFETSFARRVFPCFDEPCVRSRFKLSIQVPEGMTALSNFPIESISDSIITFEETSPIPTYLVAFVIGKMIKIEGKTKRGITVSVYAAERFKRDIFKLETYLNETIDSIDFLERYYGVNIEVPHLQVAFLPTMKCSGMENFGLITLTQDMLDFTNYLIVNHEVAHHWAGDMTSPNWWSDIWAKEAFGTYMPIIMHRALHPGSKIADQAEVDIFTLILNIDFLPYSRPINFTTFKDTEEVLNPFAYEKAGVVMRMLENFITTEKFREALSLFYRRNQFKSVDQSALIETFIEVCSDNAAFIEEFFDCWFNQTGYPLIILTNDGTIIQTSFDETDFTWKIPIEIKYVEGNEAKTMKLILDENPIKLPEKSESVIINPGFKSLCATWYQGKYHSYIVNAIKESKVSKAEVAVIETCIKLLVERNLCPESKLEEITGKNITLEKKALPSNSHLKKYII